MNSTILPSKSLCRLICDTNQGVSHGIAPNIALRKNLARALFAISIWKSSAYKTGDGVSVATYIRRFLEGSTTALLYRIDPLRILALRELQRGGSYQLTKRNALAIQWSGDIVPNDKSQQLFKDCEPTKLDRALFSDLHSLAVWQPALEDLQNYLSNKQSNSPWQLELLNLEPDSFSQKAAGQLNNCYSYFSKGVHNEWVDRRRVGMLESDARTYTNATLKHIAFSAAVLCFSFQERNTHAAKKVIEHLTNVEAEFGKI